MRISEIFYSVQGEGKLTGVPSVFIRTSGCNLRCRWCDTPYASWKPEGTEMSIAEIMAQVSRHPTHYCVVTGGEPMIAKGMRELLETLCEGGKHITIETAGTVPPDGVPCDLASVSPKLANSTPDAEDAGAAWVERHENLRSQPEILNAWCEAYEHQLKFVISGQDDLAEIEGIVAGVGARTSPENVLLMPEGRTQEEQSNGSGHVVEWCKERGWRYCARLHIELFGNKRGT